MIPVDDINFIVCSSILLFWFFKKLGPYKETILNTASIKSTQSFGIILSSCCCCCACFNRYNDEQDESQKVQEHQASIFKNETSKVFNPNFKGFEYKVGEKRYRFNVKDADKIKTEQSDISNFVKRFLNKNNEMQDAAGYHKSLFTAMNPDIVANHFYEQGRADAIKDSIAKAKNVSMDPRQTHKTVEAGGMKVRAITGDDSNAFKVRFNKK